MYVFLGMNGQRLVTDANHVQPRMDAVASGDPQELATWIRDYTEPWGE